MDKLNWTLTLNPNNTDDTIYQKHIQAYVFEVTRNIDLTKQQRERFNSEYNAFVQLEADILEGVVLWTSVSTKPTIYGYYLWLRSYDKLAYISQRKTFIDQLSREYKDPLGMIGKDYFDPSSGEYKFIQTRLFFEPADDLAYEDKMKQYVYQMTSKEPPQPRFKKETDDYQTYINSRSTQNAYANKIKWPASNNRFAYYKYLYDENKPLFDRQKIEYTSKQKISSGSFPWIEPTSPDDIVYNRWVLTIIEAKLDESAQDRSIFSPEFKPRFDDEYAAYQRYLNDKIQPEITNRYAFYKHLQLTDPIKFADYLSAAHKRQEELTAISQICPMETLISGLVYLGANKVQNSKQGLLREFSEYAITHTAKQIILADRQPSDKTDLIQRAQNTAYNILKSSSLQYILLSGLKYGLKEQIDYIPMALSVLSAQSIVELRQLIVDIQFASANQKQPDPKANNQLEMVIGSILFGNPEAELPSWMKENLDKSSGAVSWIIDNLELIGIVAGAVLILLILSIAYSMFKQQSITIVQADRKL